MGEAPPPADRDGDAEFAAPAAGPRSLPVAGTEQAFFRLEAKRSLQLHWRLARTVALAGAALAVCYLLAQVFWFKSWPTYRSESIVYVQPTPGKVFSSAGGPPRWPSDSNTYETYIQQQMMNVSREDVLVEAVNKLEKFQRPGESYQEAAQRLVRALDVTRAPDAYQFSISARADNPETAAQIANAVTAAYIESASRDERAGDAQRLAMLKEEKDRIQAALTADRAEQDDLNKELGVAAVGTAVPDHYDEDITQIRTELAKARTEHDVAEQKFAALGAGHGPPSAAIDAEAEEMTASDAGFVSMKQALNTRRATLISQMANLTPANPQYKQDEAELVKINADLDAKMKDLRAQAAARIQLQLRADLQRTGGVESQLNSQLRQLVGAATSATPKMQRSSDLAADITRLQTRYAAVDEQWHNLMLEDNAPAAAYQVSPAVPPVGRSKSGVLRNAFLIVLAGLFAGVLTAIAAHKLDPRIYIGADVEHVLGYAPLALLPDFNEVSEGAAEEYLLRLASAIEHGRKQGNLKNCIFTGTSPGTGVSTLVRRVRGMLEAMGRPTVLVDATGAQAPDSRADAPGREGALGLVRVQRVSRPTALLQQMAEETEAGEQSLVLADTAPLPVSAETEYMARFVDCAIVVIESGVTTRAQLRETATMLQRLSVGAVGFVLNRVGTAKADSAFRASVEAVEEHLKAQAAQSTGRTEDQRSYGPGQPAEREELAKPFTARSNFEPEVAAAAAAVARFSPPAPAAASTVPGSASGPGHAVPGHAVPGHAAPEPAVCMASPIISTPVAEAARRFSWPLSTPPVAEPAKIPAAQAVAQQVAEDVKPPVSEEPRVPSGPVSASASPFAAAAKRFSSGLPAGPGVAYPTRPVSAQPASNALPVGPEKPAAAGASTAATGPETAPVRPAANAVPDVPWWLSETPRNAEPSRPPVLWQPAKSWTNESRSEDGQPTPVANGANPEPKQDRAAEPPREAASRAKEAPGVEAAPANHEAWRSDKQDAPATRSSRLSGLRNLLFVLGVKNGRREEEPGDHNDPDAESSFDQRTERQSFERTVLEAQEHAERNIGGASPRLVTAPPEFLPPKPIVIQFDKGDARVGESSTRQDRRASADGVEILPSKHGQYKKV
jgi:uncharacterized protein involved in exopolysaccharide biosynthesis